MENFSNCKDIGSRKAAEKEGQEKNEKQNTTSWHHNVA